MLLATLFERPFGRLKRSILAIFAMLAGLQPAQAAQPAQVPTGYPLSYASVISAAENEGQITIWSVTDSQQVDKLLAGFHQLYPRIRINYVELPARELYQRFIKNADAHIPTADLLWSSAMDLQIKLVNDGYSQAYVTPEKAHLPLWAVWKNEAWGVTAEPIVFAYNRNAIRSFGKIPDTHSDLVRFLSKNARKLAGRVGTYDPSISAVGYLYLAQDKQANHNTWDLVSAMGKAKVQLYPRAEDILTRLADGRLVFGYDLIGSYALQAQAHHPDIGVVIPRDYALVMSRIAIIPASAPHAHAARVFLDYLLSSTGQRHLASQFMTPVRSDYPLPRHLQLGSASARAIRVGPALLIHQDQLTRRKFLRDWSRSLAPN